MKRGLLLFAHGARDPRWAIPFEGIARRVQQGSDGAAVELAYLEFMSPDLRTAAERLVACGCEQVDVVPLFLGAGGHVRKDLPILLGEFAAAHAHVQWHLQPAIGEIDSVVEAMALAVLALAPPAQRPV